jgi:hypothetical protein
VNLKNYHKKAEMYSIGQVLFVVLSKKSQVYPMQVVETITKKTLQGEQVTYVLQAGSDKESRVMLDSIEGEIFSSSEKARQTLIMRATSQINKLIEVAVSKSSEWYSHTEQPQTIKDLPDLMAKSLPSSQEEETSMVTMPDGSVVKVKLPKIVNES